jgi:hypothetical protein
VASSALAVWCIGSLWLWPVGASRLVEAAWLGAAIAGGTGVFWTASAMLGAPERIALRRLTWGSRSDPGHLMAD